MKWALACAGNLKLVEHYCTPHTYLSTHLWWLNGEIEFLSRTRGQSSRPLKRWSSRSLAALSAPTDRSSPTLSPTTGPRATSFTTLRRRTSFTSGSASKTWSRDRKLKNVSSCLTKDGGGVTKGQFIFSSLSSCCFWWIISASRFLKSF